MIVEINKKNKYISNDQMKYNIYVTIYKINKIILQL
jgi:hypothetical protein